MLFRSGADGAFDASPRGGDPGFVKAPDDGTLLVPDSPGNNRLDTLQNIVRSGSLGMLFFIPQIIKSLGTFTNMQVGWLTMIPYICGGIALVVWGRISDRMHERRWNLLLACVLSTGGLVLVVVVAVKALLSRRVARIGQDIGSTALTGDAWHHFSDALTSSAAFVGIATALWGGPGWESADDWAAACGTIGYEIVCGISRRIERKPV